MSSRWWPSVAVVGLAALARLPHYDIMLFAGDQITLIAQARRVLAGDWSVIGPNAAGIDVIGPVYTFLLAGLLWIRDDPATLALFNVACEVAGAWLVYDAGRRVAGSTIALVGAATYALAPVLVLSTRLIWNPSLLPALVAGGWWLIVRHCEAPSTSRLLAIAFAAGLAPTLHVTGAFFSVSLILAAIVVRVPSLRQWIAATAVCVLPLLPVLLRLRDSATTASALGARLGLMDVGETLGGIRDITLGFPVATIGWHWTAVLSASALYAQAIVSALGVGRGLARRDIYWPCWLAIALSTTLNVTSGLIYTGHLSWYYFMALAPGLCLGIARAIAGVRFRPPLAWAMTATALVSIPFLERFDRPALDAGFLSLDAQKLMVRVPPASDIIVRFPTLRDLRRVGAALRGIVPDGATAMMIGHGMRSELWRESGAELLPRAREPQANWPTEFLLMGPGATVLKTGAQLIDDRVCVSDRAFTPPWRARHDVPAGWERPEHVDAAWPAIHVPRRIARPSLGGLNNAMSTWRTPHVALRGHFVADGQDRRRAFGILIHSPNDSAHWIAQLFVNGAAVVPAKERVYTSFGRNHEWLVDATGKTRAGENVIALEVNGQTPVFDLDVFEIACLDAEWYR